jgi:hypothetical protein
MVVLATHDEQRSQNLNPTQKGMPDYPPGCGGLKVGQGMLGATRLSAVVMTTQEPALVNVSPYALIVVAHVLIAFSTVALMAIGLFALIRAGAASTIEEAGLWLRGSVVTTRLLPVGSLLLLLSGVYLAWDRWGLGTGWLEVSAVTLVLIMIAGGSVAGPHTRAVGTAVEQAGKGPVTDSIRARLAGPVLWTTEHAIAGAVVGVVFLMEIKPAPQASITTIIVAVAVGAASARLFRSRTSQPSSPSVSIASEHS